MILLFTLFDIFINFWNQDIIKYFIRTPYQEHIFMIEDCKNRLEEFI